MKDGDMEQIGQEVVKRKRHVGNPAMTGDAITIDPGTQHNLMQQSIALATMKDIDLHDVEQVQNRIVEYFEMIDRNGNRPTVTGLCLALNNISRFQLYEIVSGNYRRNNPPYHIPEEVSHIIKKAYRTIEELWENYMQTGKINPVSGIFLGKNHFGYQDKQDIVVTPQAPEGEYDAKQIADRYLLPTATDQDE